MLVLEPQLPDMKSRMPQALQHRAAVNHSNGCTSLRLLYKWQLLGFPPPDQASLPISLVPCLELASTADHKCVHCPGPILPLHLF